MPTIKLTKSAIDTLEPSAKDTMYWDAGLPGFGLKVTPKGRKVFVALYRTKGGGSLWRGGPRRHFRSPGCTTR
jgi:hypothetical protein